MPEADADTVLQISALSKTFGPIAALRDMRLAVKRGRVHALLGENGAGKSTLMKILAGIHRPSSGVILLEGRPYRPATPQEAAALGLSIVFQELSLCNTLTVAENILAAREPSCAGFIRQRVLEAKARAVVNRLGLPLNVTDRVGDLSIAQRQLVEIAKGLSIDARVVVLDEPTSSLGESESEILFKIIENLKSKGVAIIYISHKMEEIMRLSDDVTIIRDGCCISTCRREETTIQDLIALMVGRTMEKVYPPRETPAPDDSVAPVLRVAGLSRPGEFENIDFTVRPGEILGFFGLVGSGRSEVMKALFGIKRATGSVFLNGKALRIASPADAIAQGIGFLTENRKEEGMVPNQSIVNTISMASLPRFTNRYGFLRRREERHAAATEVKRLAVKTSSLSSPVGSLSGGNQQKVILAKWLLTKPKVLILDEPTRGIDVGAKFETYRLIRQLAAEGTAVLLVSSELPEVLGISDRVAVMHEGRLIAVAAGADLNPQTIMTFATGRRA